MEELSVNLSKTLSEVFGFNDLRPNQKPIVSSIMKGNDVLAILKTSGGKSLCFQLPAVNRGGTTLVISPLISLMKDQVRSLEQKNIPAAYVNSSLNQAEVAQRYANLRAGRYTLFYISPERLKDVEFLGSLLKAPVHTLAIDEAHCASQWGHDFRPAYAKIGDYMDEIESHLGRHLQRLAFTATANAKAQADIVKMLRLKSPDIHIQDFDRENITYSVIESEKPDRTGEVLSLVQQHPDDCIIVYCVTVKEVERITTFLNQSGVPAVRYHGKLDSKLKDEIQDKFISGEARVLVATSAFGMGVDKSNVRVVIHAQMPGSLEAWYQEAGRAGRDGLPCKAILLYHHSDKSIHQFFIGMVSPSSVKIPPIKQMIQRILSKGPADLNYRHIAIQVSKQQGIIERVFNDEPSKASRITFNDVKAAIGLLVTQGELTRYDGSYDIADWQPEDDYLWVDEVRRNNWLKFNAMCSLCETHLCRRWQILRYFDENKPHYRCGNCDNCHREALAVQRNGKIEKAVRPSTLISLARCLNPLAGSEGTRWIHVLLGTLHEDELTPAEVDSFGRFSWNAVADLKRWRSILVDQNVINEDNSLTEMGAQWCDGTLRIEYKEIPPDKPTENAVFISPVDIESSMRTIRAWRKAASYREDIAEIQILNEHQLRSVAAMPVVSLETLLSSGFSKRWISMYGIGITKAIEKARAISYEP